MKILIFLMIFIIQIPAIAQDKQTGNSVTQQFQFWSGYMTTTRLSNWISWWNDAHYVPGSFIIVRTGLSLHIKEGPVVTGGFAHMWLRGTNNQLNRNENRPWAQITYGHDLGTNLNLSHRLRYDARFQQIVDQNILIDEYSFHNRFRYMITLKKYFNTSGKVTPFIRISQEIHVNAGELINKTQRIDQHRIWLMGGLKYNSLTLQAGYGNRTVMRGSPYIMNHTLTIWVNQVFDLRVLK